jgi:hypothetical protein
VTWILTHFRYNCVITKILNQAIQYGPTGRRDIMNGETRMMDILRLEQALGVVFEVEKDKEK